MFNNEDKHRKKLLLQQDLDLVSKYTDLVGYYFRKFKVNCESCVNKTEKEFHYIFNDLWNLIHTLPYKLETEIKGNPFLKQKIDLFYNKIKFLPCKICKQHYVSYLRNNPLRNIKTNTQLQYWTVDLHNDVNSRLNKNTFSYNQAKYKYRNLNINMR